MKIWIYVLVIAAVLVVAVALVPRPGYAQVDVAQSLDNISKNVQDGKMDIASRSCAVLLSKLANQTQTPCCGQETYETLNFSLNHLNSALRRNDRAAAIQELNSAVSANRRMTEEAKIAGT